MCKKNKTWITTICLLLCFVAFLNSFTSYAKSAKKWRILDVKHKIYSGDESIKLFQIISNPKILTEEEQNLIVMETPLERSRSISINELAYKLRKYTELHDTKLRGPRSITFQKLQNKEYLYKAKEAITNYIKNTDPWKDWEVDILFSNDDELRIIKVGEFDKLDVMPYDNKSMIGTLAFRLTFKNKKGQTMGKTIVNPVVLKKIYVVVINTNAHSGQVIKKSDLKTVPLWVGDQKKNYITSIKRCIGKELARKMTYGDIIREADLLNQMCVKRGDLIWVRCQSGALTVKVAAVALQKGREGDFIRVKNKASQKEFMVELIGPKKAVFNTSKG